MKSGFHDPAKRIVRGPAVGIIGRAGIDIDSGIFLFDQAGFEALARFQHMIMAVTGKGVIMIDCPALGVDGIRAAGTDKKFISQIRGAVRTVAEHKASGYSGY